MGEAMMDKFNKYWEEPNNVMVIATILDPRYKLKYIKWGFYKIYGRDKAAAEYDLIENGLVLVFSCWNILCSMKTEVKNGLVLVFSPL
jgi:hypothetical protein